MINELTDALIGVCRGFGATERTAVRCGDVNVAQCIALQYIKPESPTVSAPADFMGVTRGSATKLADGMVQRNWVMRTKDQDDGRRVRLELTAIGIELAIELRQRTEAMVGAMVDGLSKEEKRSLLRALRLLENMFGAACCSADRTTDREQRLRL